MRDHEVIVRRQYRDQYRDNVRFFHELLSGCEIKSAISTFLNPACDAPAQEIAV